MALAEDGKVFSWGDGLYGRLGHGDGENQLLPKLVAALVGKQVVQISCGGYHSLAVTASGAVYSWGYGDDGKLGHGNQEHQMLPKEVEALRGRQVTMVSAGGSHSLALTASGEVLSWGGGYYGKLGHGDEENQLRPKVVEALQGTRVVQISGGNIHTLALAEDGKVFSWGDGGNGLLGHGHERDLDVPTEVEALRGKHVMEVRAGYDTSLVLTWAREVLEFGVSLRDAPDFERKVLQPEMIFPL